MRQVEITIFTLQPVSFGRSGSQPLPDASSASATGSRFSRSGGFPFSFSAGSWDGFGLSMTIGALVALGSVERVAQPAVAIAAALKNRARRSKIARLDSSSATVESLA